METGSDFRAGTHKTDSKLALVTSKTFYLGQLKEGGGDNIVSARIVLARVGEPAGTLAAEVLFILLL